MATNNSDNINQLLATNSSPTFAALTLSSALTVPNGGTGLNTFATGDILFASATNTLSRLPISSNIGDFLQYNGTNVAWLGPHNCCYMYDDCFTILGPYGSSGSVAGTGSAITATASLAGNPGILTLTVGTTNSSAVAWSLTGSIPSKPVFIGQGAIYSDLYVQQSQLSNGTDRYTFNIGFNLTSGGPSTVNSVYFTYSDNVNSGNWVIKSISGSTTTSVNTSVAADTSWHRFTIIANAAGSSLMFYIDSVQVGTTITTNIPTVGLEPFCHMIKSAGTTSVNFLLDYCKYIQLLTTTR